MDSEKRKYWIDWIPFPVGWVLIRVVIAAIAVAIVAVWEGIKWLFS